MDWLVVLSETGSAIIHVYMYIFLSFYLKEFTISGMLDRAARLIEGNFHAHFYFSLKPALSPAVNLQHLLYKHLLHIAIVQWQATPNILKSMRVVLTLALFK